MASSAPGAAPVKGTFASGRDRRLEWSPLMIILGLLTLALAFPPFVTLQARLTGQEGPLVGTAFGVVLGPEGQLILMFWDLYRLVPSIHDAPALLSMFGVTGVPDWAVRFCTTPIWLSRLAVIFPFVAGTMLVAGAFLVRWINRSAVQAIIGAAAVIIGAVILGRMIGAYILLVLSLGLCIPLLIAGAGITLKRPIGSGGKTVHCAAACVLALFAAGGMILLVKYWRPTFADRLGSVDPVVGLAGMSLLLVAAVASILAIGAGASPSGRLLMRASQWICILTLLALPIYTLTRTTLLVRDQAQERIRELQPNTLMASSDSADAAQKKSRGKRRHDLSEHVSRVELPQIDAGSVARTFALLTGKLLAFTYLFFWLLGSGLAGLLYRPSTLGRPAAGRM